MIYTIELNLDDDYASECAYHVDDQRTTFLRNIRHAVREEKTNRWAVVGLASSFEEALEKCHQLRMLLCKIHNRKPYNIEDLLYEDKEDLMNQKMYENIDEEEYGKSWNEIKEYIEKKLDKNTRNK